MKSIDEFFDKYSELCSFEESPSEYLIDKSDFKSAMQEYKSQLLEEFSEILIKTIKIKCLNAESFGPNNMDYCSDCEYHILDEQSIKDQLDLFKKQN